MSELPVRSDLQHTPGQNYFPIRDEINFRDLGGYRSSDGRMIRQGCFYRSGGLYKMNDSELAFLKSLQIRTLLDLRTKAEAAKKPDPVLPGVTVLQHSGVVSAGGEEIDFSPAGMKLLGEAGLTQIENMHQYYRMMPFHNEALHILMKEVICGNVPVLFHCATGKDRTGVAAMILLLLLGVPEQTVLQDYLLSNFYRRDVIRRHM
ncbi:MAG: tyrosine-protein phosphatase, partial [Lachnospiraceae bacterium]|nr:tyrosine-protein phosphatase [Lachnospiraceae bacterium]